LYDYTFTVFTKHKISTKMPYDVHSAIWEFKHAVTTVTSH